MSIKSTQYCIREKNIIYFMLLKALKKCKFREMACYCNVNTTLIHYCYTSICLFFMLKICLVCFAKGKFVYFSRKQFLYSYTVLYHLAIMCFEFFHICVANKNKNKKSQFFFVFLVIPHINRIFLHFYSRNSTILRIWTLLWPNLRGIVVNTLIL